MAPRYAAVPALLFPSVNALMAGQYNGPVLVQAYDVEGGERLGLIYVEPWAVSGFIYGNLYALRPLGPAVGFLGGRASRCGALSRAKPAARPTERPENGRNHPKAARKEWVIWAMFGSTRKPSGRLRCWPRA